MKKEGTPEQSVPLVVDVTTTARDLAPPPVKSPGHWSVLRNRNYALLFWGQLISAAGTQMQIVAVSWQVYQLTHSAISLGIIGLLQAIPRLLLSLVGGVLADSFDRRKMLLLIELIMAILSAILALCTMSGRINVYVVYTVIFASACVSAFEFPVQQAIIPTLVPRDQMASAVSLSSVMMQLTFVIGSSFGGYLIGWWGIVTTYWLDVVTYFVVLGTLCLMHVPRRASGKDAQPGIQALVDGIRFLRAHPIILAVLSIDFFATFFGSPKALLPVYANDILRVGAQGLGVLVAATSIGAVLLTPLTGLINRIPRQGLGVVLAVLGWGVCVVGFGLAPGPLWLSTLLLAGAGAADMVSMILRGLIVQLTTPDEFRGRISSVNAMFVLGGPMLGQFESGVVAGTTSPQFSVISGGIACIAATLLIALLVPSLTHVRVEEHIA
ncbi:MFS transporter [Ktedonospora formicarum]|uniref:MFS transporter n=1 Tax=Ktedonospora formicarum TaxID=2778364 RepID=A0A8J3IE04_9CHLR|nr:MFS transporter [Ktedonospora formicarum]GHO50269.1 MFS transporter [Ktedonospora formicarum]